MHYLDILIWNNVIFWIIGIYTFMEKDDISGCIWDELYAYEAEPGALSIFCVGTGSFGGDNQELWWKSMGEIYDEFLLVFKKQRWKID